MKKNIWSLREISFGKWWKGDFEWDWKFPSDDISFRNVWFVQQWTIPPHATWKSFFPLSITLSLCFIPLILSFRLGVNVDTNVVDVDVNVKVGTTASSLTSFSACGLFTARRPPRCTSFTAGEHSHLLVGDKVVHWCCSAPWINSIRSQVGASQTAIHKAQQHSPWCTWP